MSVSVTGNICDLKRIYEGDSGYNYSLPQGVLAGFLVGKGFPNGCDYTPEERAQLEQDINTQYRQIWDDQLQQIPAMALITAGAPGAGKTVLLEQFHQGLIKGGHRLAYTDPDAVCLKKGMPTTYEAELALTDGTPGSRLAVYNKWRAGSNASAHLMLANWIQAKIPFCFGTTSTGDKTCLLFKLLKDRGYQINLIHVTAPDEVRWGSIQERDKTFVQTTQEDIVEKGKLLPQRMMDTYLKYADCIDFYYRSEVTEDPSLVAIWTRTDAGRGTLDIKDADLYDSVKEIHNAAIVALKMPRLSWEETVEKQSSVTEGALDVRVVGQ